MEILDLIHPRSLLLTILLITIIHRLHKHITHPLYRFPGPISARWSNFLHCKLFLSGRHPYELLALHNKYGPVLRIAPNELSFSSPASWNDIYGFRHGHQVFMKSDFYDGSSFADQARSIVNERDPVLHGQMRKDLSHAFSDASLKKQEPLIAETVDLFIKQLGKYGEGEEGLDIVKWFNLATFDIIGSLAFGESFGGLESQRYHFWIDLTTGALQQTAIFDTMHRFPLLAKICSFLMPGMIKKLIEDTKIHEAHTMSLVERRINNPSPRPDFLTRILERKPDISHVQLAAHSSDFVIAGSETTATVLSCVTYYLFKTPHALAKLQQEIRSTFTRYEDITAQSASKLPYLHAVCLEGMRIYPPLPFALPRVVPEGGDTIGGQMIPGGTIVTTNPVAASLSAANFEDPFTFCPERWLGDNPVDKLQASQPFSLGARGCIGRNLAWIEMVTILAKLHFTYNMAMINTELDWHGDSKMAILWQKPELMVRLTRRDT